MYKKFTDVNYVMYEFFAIKLDFLKTDTCANLEKLNLLLQNLSTLKFRTVTFLKRVILNF